MKIIPSKSMMKSVKQAVSYDNNFTLRKQFFRVGQFLSFKKKNKDYGLHASSAAPITTVTSSDRLISEIFLSDSYLAV